MLGNAGAPTGRFSQGLLGGPAAVLIWLGDSWYWPVNTEEDEGLADQISFPDTAWLCSPPQQHPKKQHSPSHGTRQNLAGALQHAFLTLSSSLACKPVATTLWHWALAEQPGTSSLSQVQLCELWVTDHLA